MCGVDSNSMLIRVFVYKHLSQPDVNGRSAGKMIIFSHNDYFSKVEIFVSNDPRKLFTHSPGEKVTQTSNVYDDDDDDDEYIILS